MRFLITILLFTLAITTFGQEFEQKDELLILNDNNFHAAIQKFDYLMVEFMAPWCEACTLFQTEYEKAAKTLSTHDPVIKVAQINGPQSRTILQEFNVTSYPTMKFFIRGDVLNYKMKALAEQDVLDYVAATIGPGKSKLINSKKQLEQFNQSNSVIVAYFGPNDDAFQRFETLTKSMEDIFFGHSFDENLMEELQINQPSVVLFKKVEEFRTDYTGPFTLSAMEKFVKYNKLGLLVRYNSDVHKFLEQEQKYILLMLYPRNIIKSEEAQKAKEELNRVAFELKDEMLVGLCNIDEEEGKKLADKLAIDKNGDFPLLRIFKVTNDQYEKYKINEFGEINYENIMKFYKLFKEKQLKSYLKSSQAPKEQSQVIELTGDTFEAIVYDKTKDVLIMYYTKSCTQCKKVEKILAKASEYYSEAAPNLIFAKINMDLNETPEPLGTTEYPEVRFHTTRRKKGPAFWKKPYEFNSLLKFMKTKITVDVNKKKVKEEL